MFSILQKLIPGLAELTSNKRLRMAEHVIANVSHILIVRAVLIVSVTQYIMATVNWHMFG